MSTGCTQQSRMLSAKEPSNHVITLLNIWNVHESMQGAFLWVNHSAFLMPPRISAMIVVLFYLVHLILRCGAGLVLLL